MEKSKVDIHDQKVGIIGLGRLGYALAVALQNKMIQIDTLVDTNEKKLEQANKNIKCSHISTDLNLIQYIDILFITVPDDAITPIIEQLAKSKIVQFVFHTSGVLASDVFNPLREKGSKAASMHPVQSFSGKNDDWKKLENIYFGLEGDEEALQIAKQIIKILNSNWIVVAKSHKIMYHLACVFASNYLVSLMKPVFEIFQKMQINESDINRILYPLQTTTLENIVENGLARALTGPISRGDIETIRKHFQVLSTNFPEYLTMYKELGNCALSFEMVKNSISGDQLSTLEKMFNE